MAHFLNVKNQDIKVKAGAEMRISLTTDATLHCGDKASFLINEFGVSRLKIGKKKFKVDDKMNLFFFWPSNPTALKYYDDGSTIDKHKAEYDTTFNIKSDKDLIGIVYVDNANDSLSQQKVNEQIAKYSSKYAKTPNFPTEEDGSWVFDTWQQFDKTVDNSISYYFKPIFKLNRVNARKHYYGGNDNEELYTGYNPSSFELPYDKTEVTKKYRELNEEDINKYGLFPDGYSKSKDLNKLEIVSYDGYDDTYYYSPSDFQEVINYSLSEQCSAHSYEHGHDNGDGVNIKLSSREYVNTTYKENLPETLTDTMIDVDFYQNTLERKYKVSISPDVCKDCSNNSIYWTYKDNVESETVQWEANTPGKVSENELTPPTVSQSHYLLNFTNFTATPDDNGAFVYSYDGYSKTEDKTSEPVTKESSRNSTVVSKNEEYYSGFQYPLQVKFLGNMSNDLYDTPEEAFKNSTWPDGAAKEYWFEANETVTKTVTTKKTTTTTTTTKTTIPAFTLKYNIKADYEVDYYDVVDNSITSVSGKDYEKLKAEGKISQTKFENRGQASNIVESGNEMSYYVSYNSDEFGTSGNKMSSKTAAPGDDIYAGYLDVYNKTIQPAIDAKMVPIVTTSSKENIVENTTEIKYSKDMLIFSIRATFQ